MNALRLIEVLLFLNPFVFQNKLSRTSLASLYNGITTPLLISHTFTPTKDYSMKRQNNL